MDERERALRGAIGITLDRLRYLRGLAYEDSQYCQFSKWEALLHVHNYLIAELETLCPTSNPNATPGSAA